MSQSAHFKRSALFLCFSGLLTVSFAQVNTKIDPAFRYLINNQKSRRATVPAPPSPYRLEPTVGFSANSSVAEAQYSCIVYTNNGRALRDSGIVVNSVLPTFATVWASLEQIERLAGMAQVKYIEAPAEDKPLNDVARATSGASLLHAGSLNNTSYKGKGVIVAVYDSGIDWDHPDFRDALDQTKSRILRLWDQTITATGGEAPPAGFSYGVEYTQAHLNDELDGTPTNFVRERDVNGHGTHVAGTAAGNGMGLASRKHMGMAPEADLIIIKGGNGSFPVSNTVDAITYLKGLANILGRPIVLNMSIGGQSGPHDGTLPHELAVDDFTTSGPGRVVVISAGNDNGSAIHNRATFAANATNAVNITVPSATTGTDVFQYSAYSSNTSGVTVAVTAPGGETVNAGINQSVSGNVLTAGFTVYVNTTILASNGQRYVNVYVARNGSNTVDPAGTWTISITNATTNSFVMDGWLNYKNAAFTNTVLVGGDNNYLVGSPGNATTAITAASFVGRLAWYSNGTPGGFSYSGTTTNDNLSTFSSWGPRRDGFQKPEIAATGQAVISCLSSDITPAPAASDIVEVGLYKKDQGTSMASPATAGAVALLLQTNNSLTAATVKNLIINNATKDALTELPGATPNPRWGYGKLDIFRAAATSFNCSPAEHRLYQYDIPFNNTQNAGVLIGAQHVAVRFTPDISGKLGGVYFHSAATTTVTDLVAEIRNNNSGVPGATVMGTVNISAANVSKHSWNYLSFAAQNITVTSGTDYFVVIRRDASSTGSWSLTRENTAVDGRTQFSSDNGVTWAAQAFDYKIRSDVYGTSQLAGAIVNANATDTRDILSSNQFLANCSLIAQVAPNGGSPVSGNVTGNVWIESAVPHVGTRPFVARHYEITPATFANTATGRITLYFTQAEFNAFNSDAGSTMDLPTGPADVTGKANLLIGKFNGTSNDGTGLPASYTNGASIIDPADSDIIWNADASRWEVSFDVTGFSGFIVQTDLTPLPIGIEFFSGRTENSKNKLSWKATCSNVSTILFEVERSANGVDFVTIGAINATQTGCAQPFSLTDAAPLPGGNYYRLKMIEDGGRYSYSKIVLLQGNNTTTSLLPTLIHKNGSVQVNLESASGTLSLTDALGRVVLTKQLVSGVQRLDIGVNTAGVYYYTIRSSNGRLLTQGKLVIE